MPPYDVNRALQNRHAKDMAVRSGVYQRQSLAFVSAVVNPFAFIKELHVLPSADSPILVDVAFLFFHCDRKFVDWYRYRPSVLALWFRYLESLADQSLITNVTHMCIRYYTA